MLLTWVHGWVAAGVASVVLVIGAVGGFTMWTGLTTEAGLTALALRIGLSGLTDFPLPEMVEIRAGSFMMGSPETEKDRRSNEGPQRKVTLDAFRIGKYEVTFPQYDAYVQATGLRTPDDRSWGRDKRPVINVSWDDAQDYAEWLSLMTGKRYRLPSEAEWEYAARAGTTTAYWWGDDVQQDGKVRANCKGCGSQEGGKRTAPVGSFDANPFRLHDTAGNVWEWVQDCYVAAYDGAPVDGSVRKSDGGMRKSSDYCRQRVFRGGSWISKSFKLRSAYRFRYFPDYRFNTIGFRLAQD